MLKADSPTHEDLQYIIEYCPAEALKNSVGEVLKAMFNITEEFDQEVLIRKIAAQVLAQPSYFNQDSWHCGTTHCTAGWGCVLDPGMAKIEKKIGGDLGTEISGCIAMPKYAHLFFKSNEEVLEVFKTLTEEV